MPLRPRPQLCLKVTADLHETFASVQKDADPECSFHQEFMKLIRDERELIEFAPVGLNRPTSKQPPLHIRYVYALHSYMNIINDDLVEGHPLFGKTLQGIFDGCALEIPSKELTFPNPNQEKRKKALYTRAEERQYKKMIASVDPDALREKKDLKKAGPTVKNGMIVVHMMVGLFAGFFGGYMIAKKFTASEKDHMLGGLVGLMFVFLLEMFVYLFTACKAEVYENERLREARAAAVQNFDKKGRGRGKPKEKNPKRKKND